MPGSAAAKPMTIPDEMLGQWCPAPEPSGRNALTVYVRPTVDRKVDPDCMEVTRTGTHGMEDQCKFVRITRGLIVYMRCWSAGDDQGPVPDKHPISASIFEIDDGKLKLWDISPGKSK
jgi:hypothetical protein